MHLTIGPGLLNSVILRWNDYEGYIPKGNTLYIWRWASSTGLTELTQVPDDQYSYQDFSVPSEEVWYYVEAVHPTGCTPLKAATYNSSRSNRKTKFKAAPDAIESFINEYNLVIYPNPSEGLFKLKMDFNKVEDLNIKVFDLSGKLVHLKEFRNIGIGLEHDIDLTGFERGIYQLLLKTDSGLYNKTIVIQ